MSSHSGGVTPTASSSTSPFASFWQAGYEGADHVNHAGTPQDMNLVTGHRDRAREDYANLARFNIRTVRESIGWRLAERDGVFDFSILDARLQAAREFGIQICWSFCHYGWPDEVDVYGDQFVPRFARYFNYNNIRHDDALISVLDSQERCQAYGMPNWAR